MQIKKFVLGVRSSTRLFKVSSEWGAIIDGILDQRGDAFAEDYYTRIAETETHGIISLLNEKQGNVLTISREGVIIEKSGYLSEKRVDIDSAFSEFQKIWSVTNKLVSMRDVRRIGMVVEWRFRTESSSSAELLSKLTKLPSMSHPASFHVRFENRRIPVGEPEPDVNKSDFINVISELYDSAIDTDKPEKGMINVNLDYQHYFAPPLVKNVPPKIEEHFFQLKKELSQLEQWMRKLDLGPAHAKD